MSSSAVYRVDLCKVCYRWVDRRILRRCKITYMQPATENRFLYSSPADGGWSTDATEETDYALGPRIDAHYEAQPDNTWRLFNGSKTYSGSPGNVYSSTTYDVSTWTNFLFRVRAGCKEPASEKLTVSLGVCEDGYVNATVLKTYISPWIDRYAFVAVANSLISGSYDTSALAFFVRVTPTTATTVWWVDNFQLVKDVTGFVRGSKEVVAAADVTSSTTIPFESYPFIRTVGAAVVFDADTPTQTVQPVCPECRNTYRRQTSEGVRIEEPTEPIEGDGRASDGIWR